MDLTITAVEENGRGGYKVFASDDLLKVLKRNHEYISMRFMLEFELYIDDNPRLVGRFPAKEGPGPECCLPVVSNANLGKKIVFLKQRASLLSTKGDDETGFVYVVRWRENYFELIKQ